MESEIPTGDLRADMGPATGPVEEDNSETSYASGDTLGKLWAFINQVRRVCCTRDREYCEGLQGFPSAGDKSAFTQDWALVLIQPRFDFPRK